MRTILLTISYDGTDYCGWQRQSPAGNNSLPAEQKKLNPPACDADISKHKKAVPTVQEEIEKALETLHKQPVSLAGSGRTDSGVHAVGQAATFVSPIDSIPVQNYIPALNSILPQDIRIVDAQEKEENFHARFSAKRRTYRYFINISENPLAHSKRFSWSIFRQPDINKLNEMASVLRGELDCTTFAAAGDKSPSKSRFIEDAFFYTETTTPDNLEKKIVFEITANAFLWNMVRSIVGTLIFFEKTGKTKEDFENALNSKDRKNAGPTAPPTGLFLWKVGF